MSGHVTRLACTARSAADLDIAVDEEVVLGGELQRLVEVEEGLSQERLHVALLAVLGPFQGPAVQGDGPHVTVV